MFAVLVIPEFQLQAVLRLAAARPDSARMSRDRRMAVMIPAGRDGGAAVLQCNDLAAAAGVAPGLTAPQAMARCPGIELHARSESAEAAAHEAALAAAWTLSPRVEDTAPGVCTIDLRGHKDPEKIGALARAAIVCLARLGLTGRIGIARTPRIARYAALSTGSGQADIGAVAPVARPLRGRVSHEPALGLSVEALAKSEDRGLPSGGNLQAALSSGLPLGGAACPQDAQEAFASQASALGIRPSHEASEDTATRSTSEDPVYSNVARVSDPRRQVGLPCEALAKKGDLPYASPVSIIPPTDSDERAFLAPLPVALAEPTEEQAAVLAGWGIDTLGGLTALPRAEAAMRLGAEGGALWDRAAGREERVLRHAQPRQTFEAEFEFEEEIETLEPLLFLLKRFCDQLALQLAAAGFAATEMRLELALAGGAYARDFQLPGPTGDPGVLFRVLQTHLESLQTDTPVVALRLGMTPARPLQRQRGLFDSSLVDPHGLNETLARVGAVVGPGRVGVPVLENTRRPDAVRLGPVPERVEWQSQLGGGAVLHGLPLRRHRPPRPARVEVEDGRPVWVLADGMAGPVVAAEGPWRGSGEWWCAEAWSRDEWDVEIGGVGLHRIFESDGQWFVEGEYD